MKFYVDDTYNHVYWYKIYDNKLTAIYYNGFAVRFYKNGKKHNNKNAALIRPKGHKEFVLNNKLYGYHDSFTKESWRRFCKLQAFL
jgi:hypothetical protein